MRKGCKDGSFPKEKYIKINPNRSIIEKQAEQPEVPDELLPNVLLVNIRFIKRFRKK